jgi:hypothetical protein
LDDILFFLIDKSFQTVPHENSCKADHCMRLIKGLLIDDLRISVKNKWKKSAVEIKNGLSDIYLK